MIISKATTVEVGYNKINYPTSAIFKIADSKLYVPNDKFFFRTIKNKI